MNTTPASSFEYIETTLPPGLTIAKYRAARPPRPTPAARILAQLFRRPLS
jgi:hypothetical protein